MSFEADSSGYFLRKVSVPVNAEGSLDNGMLRFTGIHVSIAVVFMLRIIFFEDLHVILMKIFKIN